MQLLTDALDLWPRLCVSHVGLPDVERLARKLERRKASLADLCQLYRASSRLPMLVEAFTDYEGPHAELLTTRCV